MLIHSYLYSYVPSYSHLDEPAQPSDTYTDTEAYTFILKLALILVVYLDEAAKPSERAAADEEDVGGVDAHVLRPRILPPPLLGNVHYRPLEQLEQRLRQCA